MVNHCVRTTYGVSVPRRALRGHAPVPQAIAARIDDWGFSAPKGVERACPSMAQAPISHDEGFSAPKGVERACPLPGYDAHQPGA